MKKTLYLLVMCVIMAVIVSGCGFSSVNKENSSAKMLKVATTEDILNEYAAENQHHEADSHSLDHHLANSEVYTGSHTELIQALGVETGNDKALFTGISIEEIYDKYVAEHQDSEADSHPFDYHLANSEVYTGFNTELIQFLGLETVHDKALLTGNTFEDILNEYAAEYAAEHQNSEADHPFEHYLADSEVYTGFNIELMQALGMNVNYNTVLLTEA